MFFVAEKKLAREIRARVSRPSATQQTIELGATARPRLQLFQAVQPNTPPAAAATAGNIVSNTEEHNSDGYVEKKGK